MIRIYKIHKYFNITGKHFGKVIDRNIFKIGIQNGTWHHTARRETKTPTEWDMTSHSQAWNHANNWMGHCITHAGEKPSHQLNGTWHHTARRETKPPTEWDMTSHSQARNHANNWMGHDITQPGEKPSHQLNGTWHHTARWETKSKIGHTFTLPSVKLVWQFE